MKLFKQIIRLIFLSFVLSIAMMGMPVVLFPKRDDIFDNEIKIEKLEAKKDKMEAPNMHDLME